MSDTNDKTIKVYNDHVQEYIDSTPQVVRGIVKDWIDSALTGLPKDARILEIGSASGRDADYIESKGFKVTRTDVTPGFVKLLQQQGHQASMFNAITDDLHGPYDLIFANAVLLHFTRDETQSVIKKMYRALSPHGRFAISLKLGKGEGWKNNKFGARRYFCHWNIKTIRPLIEQAGFGTIHISDDYNGSTAKWLHIIADR